MLKLASLALPEVQLVTPELRSDERGDVTELYNEDDFARAGIATRFVVGNHVRNVRAHVVRGLHFQAPPHAQAKLLRVTRGRILDVAVDLRDGSANFGRHVAVELSADRIQWLYVPEGFGHGFSVLENGSEVHYKVNRYVDLPAALGVRWDDPALGIDWHLSGPPILAERDAKHPLLADLPRGVAGAIGVGRQA
jgi:dTDP-4-dehydrorhamnose 3,5-epimerase